jgi:hypothetical protein
MAATQPKPAETHPEPVIMGLQASDLICAADLKCAAELFTSIGVARSRLFCGFAAGNPAAPAHAMPCALQHRLGIKEQHSMKRMALS